MFESAYPLPDPWRASPQLDELFRKIYYYFEARGYWCIILRDVKRLLAITVTIWLSYVLAHVNFYDIVTCSPHEEDHSHCASAPLFSEFSFNLSFVVCLAVYGACLTMSLNQLRNSFIVASEMQTYFETKLQIPDENLQTAEWSEVLERVIALPEHKSIGLDELHITHLIMRKDNFLYALVKFRILNLSPRSAFLHMLGRHDEADRVAEEEAEYPYVGKFLDLVLRRCLDDVLSDKDQNGQRRIMSHPRLLAEKLRKAGMLYAVACIPAVGVFALYFLMKNLEEFFSKKLILGSEQWTPVARWKFRLFNELPHQFEMRLNKGREPATKYLTEFPARIRSIVFSFFTFVFSALIAPLLVIWFVNPPALAYFHIFGDVELLWLFGVFGACLAVSRALTTADHTEPIYEFNPERIMHDVNKYAQNVPEKWFGQCHKQSVRDEFSRLYSYANMIFFQELLNILCVPLIFIFALPRNAAEVCRYIEDYSLSVQHIGTVYELAHFINDKSFVATGNNGVGGPDAMGQSGVVQRRAPAAADGRRVGDESSDDGSDDEDFGDERSGLLSGGRDRGDRSRRRQRRAEEDDEERRIRREEQKHRHPPMLIRKSAITFFTNNPHWKPGPAGAQVAQHLLGASRGELTRSGMFDPPQHTTSSGLSQPSFSRNTTQESEFSTHSSLVGVGGLNLPSVGMGMGMGLGLGLGHSSSAHHHPHLYSHGHPPSLAQSHLRSQLHHGGGGALAHPHGDPRAHSPPILPLDDDHHAEVTVGEKRGSSPFKRENPEEDKNPEGLSSSMRSSTIRVTQREPGTSNRSNSGTGLSPPRDRDDQDELKSPHRHNNSTGGGNGNTSHLSPTPLGVDQNFRHAQGMFARDRLSPGVDSVASSNQELQCSLSQMLASANQGIPSELSRIELNAALISQMERLGSQSLDGTLAFPLMMSHMPQMQSQMMVPQMMGSHMPQPQPMRSQLPAIAESHIMEQSQQQQMHHLSPSLQPPTSGRPTKGRRNANQAASASGGGGNPSSAGATSATGGGKDSVAAQRPLAASPSPTSSEAATIEMISSALMQERRQREQEAAAERRHENPLETSMSTSRLGGGTMASSMAASSSLSPSLPPPPTSSRTSKRISVRVDSMEGMDGVDSPSGDDHHGGGREKDGGGGGAIGGGGDALPSTFQSQLPEYTPEHPPEDSSFSSSASTIGDRDADSPSSSDDPHHLPRGMFRVPPQVQGGGGGRGGHAAQSPGFQGAFMRRSGSPKQDLDHLQDLHPVRTPSLGSLYQHHDDSSSSLSPEVTAHRKRVAPNTAAGRPATVPMPMPTAAAAAHAHARHQQHLSYQAPSGAHLSPRLTLDPPLSRRTTSDENLPASMFRAEAAPVAGTPTVRDSQIPHVQHIRHLPGTGSGSGPASGSGNRSNRLQSSKGGATQGSNSPLLGPPPEDQLQGQGDSAQGDSPFLPHPQQVQHLQQQQQQQQQQHQHPQEQQYDDADEHLKKARSSRGKRSSRNAKSRKSSAN